MLDLSEQQLATHALVIGATGTGKTSLLSQVIAQVKRSLGPRDSMVVFDSKGDFLDLFFDPGRDLVLGDDASLSGCRHGGGVRSEGWNLFREIMVDGKNEERWGANVEEVAEAVFSRSIERSNSPFFPGAARDLFASILTALVRNGLVGGMPVRSATWNNAALRRYMDSKANRGDLRKLFSTPSMKDQASVLDYLGMGDSSEQGDGVLAEMKHALRGLLRGCFAREGSLSVRDFVRNGGGRTLFVEYDLSRGSSLASAYGLVVDLALKEGLGREKGGGRLFVFADEFRLLPRLSHIGDALNFGRSQGVVIFLAMQSVEQLEAVYGSADAKSLLAGLRTAFCFTPNDAGTRAYVRDRFGGNVVVDGYRTAVGGIASSMREGHVVEDWDLYSLRTGECVVGLPGEHPFVFRVGKP